ncbi:MAG: hypothetical protein CMM46_10200 [Rhodospirillaceae bacterium]|nr:hypothetical protein [Rhodospirillaceae bacterium]|tara:strand:- start:3717 stop:4016 length:300 start_codon:yes stop_codon:yes gene_type:complete
MHKIDPNRTDLIEEFDAKPDGPHSHELALALNRLRIGPLKERFIVVCTKPRREWAVARMPLERGQPLDFIEGAVFDNADDASRKVFRLRWHAVTGQEVA